MNRYATHTPRTLPALAAIALTVATFALSVLIPAAMKVEAQDVGIVARSWVPPASLGASPVPSIEVIAARSNRVVPVALSPAPKPGLQG